MNICVLLEVYDDPANAEADLAEDGDPRIFLAGHQVELVFLSKQDSVAKITELVTRGFDVFVNLCGGTDFDDDRPGVEVIETLHRLGAAYTGAEAAFYSADRQAMKSACERAGVTTPGAVFIETEEEIEEAIADALARLNFPLLVKHPNSYASIGLTKSSRVTTTQDLDEQVRKMFAEYHEALIEEFIDGREYTVLVTENPDNPRAPVVYEPIEFRFPPGETFKHYQLKWYDYNGMTTHLVDDALLCRRLKSAARRLYLAMKGNSYARLDFRVNGDRQPYVVDVNPNCGVFYPLDNPGSADFILKNDPGGHAGFVDLILRAAVKRAAARRDKLARAAGAKQAAAIRRSTGPSRRDEAGYAPESIPYSAYGPPTERSAHD